MHPEGIEDAAGALHRDAMVLVPLVPGDLGHVNFRGGQRRLMRRKNCVLLGNPNNTTESLKI